MVNMNFFTNLIFLLLVLVNYSVATLMHRRFEYKYSFKPPYLAQKDGSVPFWEYGGSEYFKKLVTRITFLT